MSNQETNPEQRKDVLPPLHEPVIVSVTAEMVAGHIAKCLGSTKWIWRDADAVPVAVDIHVLPPTPRRNYWTLVTAGMSDRAMNVPHGVNEKKFIELTICLPERWNLQEGLYHPTSAVGAKDAGASEYWPVHWLKYAAKYPHNFGSYIGAGTVIPNGAPPAPLSGQTKQCGVLVAASTVLPKDFSELRLDRQKSIRFYSLWPVYKEEMDVRTKHGPQALYDRFQKAGLTDVVDMGRKNLGKLWGIF